jgi:LPPG:FO 2-phospho-L-lactate transferase
MMRELGLDASAAGVARHYGRLVDGWVIDRADARSQAVIAGIGCAVDVTDTIMRNRRNSAGLAQRVLDLARSLRRGAR